MGNPYPYQEKYVLTGKEPLPEIASFIRTIISRYDNQNRKTFRQWLLNAAFARGNQWSQLDDVDDRLITLRKPASRKRVTDDMIGSWKEHMIANLTVAQPIWETVPKGIKNSDIMAARTGNNILKAFWDECRFIEKDIDASGYLVDFCNALILIRYDETKREIRDVRDSETGEPIYDENGNPIQTSTEIGNIEFDVMPPEYLGCPLDPSDLDSKPWIFIRQARPLGWFHRYGEQGKKVAEEAKAAAAREYTLRDISRGRQNDAIRDVTANEVIYMQKPCDECPDGLIIPYVNETILEKDRNKWRWQFEQLKEYPVIHIHGKKESGEFWARSSIERQIPLQRYKNLLRSCMADNVDNMAHMKWGIPSSSGITDITDMNEQVVYDGQIAPAMIEIKPLPQWIRDEDMSVEASIRNIQKFHGASQGTSVSGVRSDVHAQNLQDQDLMGLTVIDNLRATGYARMGEKILRIVTEKMPDDRIMSFLDDGRPEVVANFKQAMSGGMPRVNVKMTSSRLRSKGMVKQEVYNWFAAGMIADDYGNPDAQEAMRLLEFAVPDSHFERYRLHSNQAHLENIRMYQGEVPVPYPWQNHRIHIKTHQEEMNSPDFMQLVEAATTGDTQAKRITDTFVAHVARTAELQAAAMPKSPPEGTQEGTSQKSRPAKQQTQKKTSRKE